MAIYTKGFLQAVVDLINTANPDLPFPIDATNFVFSTPTAITTTDGSGNNTSIRISAKKSSGYKGQVTVQYRRIDLNVLFRGVSVGITRYVQSGNMDLAALIPLLNEKFGLNLTSNPTDFSLSGVWGSANSGEIRNLIPAATNLHYVGSLPLSWTQGLPDLSLDVVKVTQLSGAQWPGGNDFTGDRTRQGEFMLYAMDATEIGSQLETMGTLGTNFTLTTYSSVTTQLVNWINTQDPSVRAIFTASSGNYDFSLWGKAAVRISLPATPAQIAAYPFLEAAKPGYNRVLILLGIAPTYGGPVANIPLFYNA